MTEKEMTEQEQKLIEKIAKIISPFAFIEEFGDPHMALMQANRVLALIKEAGYVLLADVIVSLDKTFDLAPHDDEYLRLLVSDLLERWRTGKTRKQRADERTSQRKNYNE